MDNEYSVIQLSEMVLCGSVTSPSPNPQIGVLGFLFRRDHKIYKQSEDRANYYPNPRSEDKDDNFVHAFLYLQFFSRSKLILFTCD
jgi:hypothetical protein